MRYSALPLRALRALALAAAGLMATLVVTATPALAGNDGACNTGELCVYEHSQFRGQHQDIAGSYQHWSQINFWRTGTSISNRVSSFKNANTTRTVHLYEHEGYGGRGLVERPRGYREDLSQDRDATGRNFNDRFSSHCWASSTCGAPIP